uniref:Uncharacterized protein n=1 Tax=Kalanchoe fedtschenkoi TaxID=63787 RepID=A0A7N0RDL1_KALFE
MHTSRNQVTGLSGTLRTTTTGHFLNPPKLIDYEKTTGNIFPFELLLHLQLSDIIYTSENLNADRRLIFICHSAEELAKEVMVRVHTRCLSMFGKSRVKRRSQLLETFIMHYNPKPKGVETYWLLLHHSLWLPCIIPLPYLDFQSGLKYEAQMLTSMTLHFLEDAKHAFSLQKKLYMWLAASCCIQVCSTFFSSIAFSTRFDCGKKKVSSVISQGKQRAL